MTFESALVWSWLNILNKKRYDALLSVYGGLDEALQHVDEELLKGLGCKEDTIYKVLNRLEEFDMDGYQTELEKREIQMLTIEDEVYPAALKATDDPPVFLYYKGSLDVLSQPCIAMVGTRAMSEYGRRVTEQFTTSFIGAGMVTVSGLAKGIDTEVARESLSAGGKTVAVLGYGFASISPVASKQLAEEIAEKEGLILSEFPLDFPGDTYTFPARNRIIAGVSLATVVLEAPEGSGALITADLAHGYSRDVFAVPGPIFDENYKGCHRIIQKGIARLASSPESVLDELGVVSSSKEPTEFTSDDPVQSALWNVLTTMPQSVGELVDKSQKDAGDINAALTMMELQGAAKNVGSGWVKR